MKHVFEGPTDFRVEDSGMAMVCDFENDEDAGLFVTLHSWDKNKDHKEAKALENKLLRVTVEEIKQPIYEHKVGYELGMGDFLIQQTQRLERAHSFQDDLDWSDVYDIIQQLKKRIGTTPYTPDGMKIPYYPVGS